MVDRECSPFGRKAARKEKVPPGIILKIIQEIGKGGVLIFCRVLAERFPVQILYLPLGVSGEGLPRLHPEFFCERWIFPASLRNLPGEENLSRLTQKLIWGEKMILAAIRE